jgi:hypothetical protein
MPIQPKFYTADHIADTADHTANTADYTADTAKVATTQGQRPP